MTLFWQVIIQVLKKGQQRDHVDWWQDCPFQTHIKAHDQHIEEQQTEFLGYGGSYELKCGDGTIALLRVPRSWAIVIKMKDSLK